MLYDTLYMLVQNNLKSLNVMLCYITNIIRQEIFRVVMLQYLCYITKKVCYIAHPNGPGPYRDLPSTDASHDRNCAFNCPGILPRRHQLRVTVSRPPHPPSSPSSP